MENITTMWGFLGLLVIQVLAFLKHHTEAKNARLAAEDAAAKAKQEIAGQRADTAQKRDQAHALLAQRVDQLEKNHHDLTGVLGKMDDRMRDISEGVAFIRGKLTPSSKKSTYVLLDDK